jgi:hypothetical protein
MCHCRRRSCRSCGSRGKRYSPVAQGGYSNYTRLNYESSRTGYFARPQPVVYAQPRHYPVQRNVNVNYASSYGTGYGYAPYGGRRSGGCGCGR